MKIIVVVLLVLAGVGMIVLTPVANVYVSSIGFKAPASVKATANEHTVATTNFARLIYAAGGLLILSGLVMSLRGLTRKR